MKPKITGIENLEAAISDLQNAVNGTLTSADVSVAGSDITFKKNLIPDADSTLSLGSATRKWKDIFVSANTIHLGDSTQLSGTSIIVDAGGGANNLASIPTIQASKMVAKPYTYNPGGGPITVRPSIEFQVGANSYPISLNTSTLEFSLDAEGNYGTGSLVAKKITLANSGSTALDLSGAISHTGNYSNTSTTSSFRFDGNTTFGYDATRSNTFKGVSLFEAAATFQGAVTMGNGSAAVTVNAGTNNFLVTSGNFNVGANGNVAIAGNLTVSGATFTINSNEVNIADAILLLNSDIAPGASPTEDAGLQIARGNQSSTYWLWDETNDAWSPMGADIKNVGTLVATSISGALTGNASTATALQTARNFSLTGGVTASAVSFNGTGNVALDASVANNHVTLARMAQLAASSIIGNNTGSPATPIALTPAQVKTMLSLSKADVGLTNVDNTSDVDKPVSTAQQTALNLKANDADVVKLTGNQTIAGNKTFSNDVTVSGKIATAASSGTSAGLILPHGTAPTSPVNGDIWSTTANLFARMNGATKTLAFTDSNITGSSATLTTPRNFSISGGGITAAAQSFDGSSNVVLSAAVDAGHVTLARLANLAANSIIGNNTGGAATPVALTATQVTAMLNEATVSLKGLMSSTDKTKLDGIASGATANSSDAVLLNRANHTGSQAISTVTGLQSAIDAKANDADVVKLTGNQSIGGYKTFAVNGTAETRIQSADNGGDAILSFMGAGYRGDIRGTGGYHLKINSNFMYGQGGLFLNDTDNGPVSIAAGGGNVGIGMAAGATDKLSVSGSISAGGQRVITNLTYLNNSYADASPAAAPFMFDAATNNILHDYANRLNFTDNGGNLGAVALGTTVTRTIEWPSSELTSSLGMTYSDGYVFVKTYYIRPAQQIRVRTWNENSSVWSAWAVATNISLDDSWRIYRAQVGGNYMTRLEVEVTAPSSGEATMVVAIEYYPTRSNNGIRFPHAFMRQGDDRILFGSGKNWGVALNRSGTTLQVRLGDNSADAALSAGHITATGNVSASHITATGNITATGTVTGANLSGTNTGDQTTITGNAGSATVLQTARNFSISGGGITAAAQSFNGSGDLTLSASVDAGHVTLARLANLAANSIIGNNTGGAATPVALTATQVTAMLNEATGSLKGLMSSTDKTKLDGVAAGATVNSTDAQLRDRATHTGTQAQSTITNLTTDLAAKANTTDVVLLTGNQSVGGIKTFTSNVVVSGTITATNHANGVYFFCAGKPTASEEIGGAVAPYAFTISAANSTWRATTAATAQTIFSIRNNNVQIGTVTFNAAATLGTVSITTANVLKDEIITIIAPATADATIAGIKGYLRN
jgi:hypothetical protein